MPDDVSLLGPRPNDEVSPLGPRPNDSTLSNLNQTNQKIGLGIDNVVHAMGGAAGDALNTDFFSEDAKNELKKSGIFAPDGQQANIVQQYNKAILAPIIAGGELFARAGAAAFGAYQAGAQQIGTEVGAPRLGRDIAAMPEAFFGSPIHGQVTGIPHIDTGKSHGLFELDSDSGLVNKNNLPPPPITSIDLSAPKPLGAPGLGPTDIPTMARQLRPEVYQTYDALTARKEAAVDNLQLITKAREQEVINSANEFAPNHEAEVNRISSLINDGNEKVLNLSTQLNEEVNKNEQRKLRTSIRAEQDSIGNLENQRNDLENVRQNFIDKGMEEITNHPEVVEARNRVLAYDNQMRDMVPALAEAKNAAEKELNEAPPTLGYPATGITTENPPVVPFNEIIQPHTIDGLLEPKQAAIGVPASNVFGTTPEHLSFIANDITKKLTGAGRPENEAGLSGQIWAAFYDKMAYLTEGTLGNAQEMYEKEAPSISQVGGKLPKAPTGLDFEQAKRGKISWPSPKDQLGMGQAVIKFMKNADASSFIHESGHFFLNAVLKYSQEPNAPTALRTLADDAKKFLGMREDANIPSTAQHETFAKGLERYFYDGIAPTKALKATFEQFRSWLLDIYGRVTNYFGPLPEQAKNVYDNLFVKDIDRQVPEQKHPAETMADIHELDAKYTPDSNAMKVADTIQSEMMDLASGHPNLMEAVNVGRRDEGTTTHGNESGAGSIEREVPGIKRGREEDVAKSNEVGAGGANAGEKGKAGEGGATEGNAGGESFGVGVKAPEEKVKPVPPHEPSAPYTEEEIAGNIRLTLLRVAEEDNTGKVVDIIKENAAMNNQFLAARRATISDKEALGKVAGVDPRKIENWTTGEAFNQEEILYLRQLFKQSALDTAEAMETAFNSGTPESLAAFAKLRARTGFLQEVLSGATAEAGRALRAFHDLEGWTDVKQFADFLRETQGLEFYQLEEMVKRGRAFSGDPGKLNDFINNSFKPDFGNKLFFYYRNSLISGIFTHIRYAVGNAINSFFTPLVEIPVAAGLSKLREVAGLGSDEKVYFREASAQLFSMLDGSRQGLKDAYTAFKTGQSPPLPGKSIPSWPVNPFESKVGQAFGNIIGVPGRSVSAIHSFFLAIRNEQNVSGLSVRAAMNEGLEPGTVEFTRRVSELKVRPTDDMIAASKKLDSISTSIDKMLEFVKGDESQFDVNQIRRIAKLRDKANETRAEAGAPGQVDIALASSKDALEELYMAPFEYNSPLWHLNKYVESNLVAKAIIPFIRVGTRITLKAMSEHSPLGLVGEERRELVSNPGAEGDIARAKMLVGTSLMGAVSLAVLNETITGDGPSDPGRRNIWLLTHKPNTVRIGDLSFDYRGLGHLGMLIRFAANMTETAKGWDHDEGENLAYSFFSAFTHSVMDENFMRGIQDVLQAMDDPKRFGSKWIDSFVTGWLPYSSFWRQNTRTLIDPYQRQINNLGWDNAWGIFDSAKSMTPILSESLMPRRDIYGQPIKSAVWEQGYEKYANDPTTQFLSNLDISIARPRKEISGVQLTPEQYDDYAMAGGSLAKLRLDALIKDESFQKLNQNRQIQAIHLAVTDSYRRARATIFAKYPDVYQEAIKQHDLDANGGE